MTWRKITYSFLIFLITFFYFVPMSVMDIICDICINEKSVNAQNICFRYISKYRYALQNELPDNLRPNGRYQNCVWTLWLQGEKNAPQIVKNCFNSFRTYLKNRRLIVLDEHSIQKYISLPNYIIAKYKGGKISKT